MRQFIRCLLIIISQSTKVQFTPQVDVDWNLDLGMSRSSWVYCTVDVMRLDRLGDRICDRLQPFRGAQLWWQESDSRTEWIFGHHTQTDPKLNHHPRLNPNQLPTSTFIAPCNLTTWSGLSCQWSSSSPYPSSFDLSDEKILPIRITEICAHVDVFFRLDFFSLIPSSQKPSVLFL